MFKVPLILLSDSFAQGFTYHSSRTPVISETMMNPVTDTIIAKMTTAASLGLGHSNTTAVPAYSTIATTVTAAVVDEAGQGDSTTEVQKSTICPSSPVCDYMCMQINFV